MTEQSLVKLAEQTAVQRMTPQQILDVGAEIAKSLQKVIATKKTKVVFNDEQYIEYEDWQFLGKNFGITAKVVSTQAVNKFLAPVKDGEEVFGFEAKAVAYQNGQEISAAEAICLRDEPNWNTRTKYEWHYVLKDGTTAPEADTSSMVWEPHPDKPGKNRPQKKKVKVGDEPVPLFQLKSMSQTRACAKTLANVLRWITVLAGYKGTPVEELPEYSRITRDEKVIEGEVINTGPECGGSIPTSEPSQPSFIPTPEPPQQPTTPETPKGLDQLTKNKNYIWSLLIDVHASNEAETLSAFTTLTAWQTKEGKQRPGLKSLNDIKDLKQSWAILYKVKDYYFDKMGRKAPEPED